MFHTIVCCRFCLRWILDRWRGNCLHSIWKLWWIFSSQWQTPLIHWFLIFLQLISFSLLIRSQLIYYTITAHTPKHLSTQDHCKSIGCLRFRRIVYVRITLIWLVEIEVKVILITIQQTRFEANYQFNDINQILPVIPLHVIVEPKKKKETLIKLPLIFLSTLCLRPKSYTFRAL